MNEVGWENGVCRTCKRPPTVRGHDPCIADLPGVNFACCGHGRLAEFVNPRGEEKAMDYCYVAFDDGIALYRNAARGAMSMLGGDPPPQPSHARVTGTAAGEHGIILPARLKSR